MWRRVPTS
uniref:Uncharacterized protein n=1 Tax=Romanomermis culicivorax TaxID=13658 RepID=A0A915HLT2_ROMCU